MKSPIVTREGRRIRLRDIDPDDDAGLGSKAKARARLLCIPDSAQSATAAR